MSTSRTRIAPNRLYNIVGDDEARDTKVFDTVALATNATFTPQAGAIYVIPAAGGGASTWTVADSVVSSIQCDVGEAFTFTVLNLSGNTMTLAVGAASTLVGTTTAVATVQVRRYLLRKTSATAVTIISLGGEAI
jgi:hypothetical protein